MNRWMGLAAVVMLAACGDEAVTVDQADGVTVQDAGGDAPDIAAPDVRVDDSGANPADVVQSETGVDAGPDAVVDDAGDVAPEVVQPAGQCLGPFDAVVREEGAAELVHTASVNVLGTCARDGLDLVECTSARVASVLAITPGCATCAAELAACAADECYETCEGNSDGPECGWCYRESGCEEAYAECSGLEPWAWELQCGAAETWGGSQGDIVFCLGTGRTEDECYPALPAERDCEYCDAVWAERVLDECGLCVGPGYRTEGCKACMRESQAASFAVYCGGSLPFLGTL
jgi:hypothetical protein